MMHKLNTIFLERLKEIYSKEERATIEKGFSIKKRKSSFRVNILKSSNEEIEKILNEKGIQYEKLDFLENGYILTEAREKDLWDLDINNEGKIYLQGITSQIPVGLVDLKPGLKVLDLTAAPGGKTSQMAAKMKNTGEIISCDLSKIRCDKLKYTLDKQGVKSAQIIKGDVNMTLKEYPDGYFDVILFDAPCSAEGRINLNTDKIWTHWSLANIKKHYMIQKTILQNNIRLLKSGGQLIYSTCTLSPEENEGILHFLLCNYPELGLDDIDINESKYIQTKPGILKFGKQCYKKEVSKSMRFLANEYSEGFFVANLRKK